MIAMWRGLSGHERRPLNRGFSERIASGSRNDTDAHDLSGEEPSAVCRPDEEGDTVGVGRLLMLGCKPLDSTGESGHVKEQRE